MNPFEYVAVLISIIIGLALTDLLVSFHRLLRAGRRVRWDWAAPLAALLVVFTLIFIWWSLYRPTGQAGALSIGQFLPSLVALVLLFLLAAAALPDDVPAEGLDLREYYDRNGRYFWGLYTATLGWLLAAEAVPAAWRRAEAGEPFAAMLVDTIGFDVVILALFASLALVRKRWWHAVGFVVLATGPAAWISRSLG